MNNLLANVRALARAAADEMAAHFPGAAPVPDTAALCVVGGRPHTATDGQLCRNHLEELGRWLHDIETEANRLVLNPDDPDAWAALPPMATRYDSSGGGSLASQRSPADLDAIAYTDQRSTAHGHRHPGPVCRRCPTLTGRRCTCPPLTWQRQVHYAGCPRHGAHPSCLLILADRDEHEARAERLVSVLAVLHGWAQRVRDERMLGIPVRHAVDRMPGVQWPGPVCALPCTHDTCQSMAWWRTIPTPPTIASERKVLTKQLDWIATQPWVLDMRRELAPLREQLLNANHNEDDQPLPGHCVWLADGAECGGDLWPTEPLHTSGYQTADGTRAVVCGRNDKHRWEGPGLARLAVIVEQQRREDTAS